MQTLPQRENFFFSEGSEFLRNSLYSASFITYVPSSFFEALRANLLMIATLSSLTLNNTTLLKFIGYFLPGTCMRSPWSLPSLFLKKRGIFLSFHNPVLPLSKSGVPIELSIISFISFRGIYLLSTALWRVTPRT